MPSRGMAGAGEVRRVGNRAGYVCKFPGGHDDVDCVGC